MTPEERAKDITTHLIGCGLDACPSDPCPCRDLIATAIREAVAERDAEIERLRAALQGLFHLIDERFDLHTDEAAKAYAAARKALKGEP